MSNAPQPEADTLRQSLNAATTFGMASRIVAFARGVVFARLLDASTLGVWALMINAIQIIGFLVTLGIPAGLRRYIERYRGDRRLATLVSGACMAVVALAAFVSIPALIFHEQVGNILFAEVNRFSLVALTFISVIVTSLLFLSRGILHGLRLFRIDARIELFYNLAFLALASVLLVTWRPFAITTAYAYAITTLLAAAALGFTGWRAARTRDTSDKVPGPAIDTNARSTFLTYSLGLWSAGSLQIVWQYLDRYMLLHLGTLGSAQTLEQLGDYFIASRLGQPLGILGGIVSSTLVPHMAHLWEQQKKHEVGQVVKLATKVVAIISTLGGALIIIITPIMVPLLIGRVPTYVDIVVAPVVATVIAVALSYVFRPYLLCRERAWVVTVVWLVALVLNLILNLVLIPRFNLSGAVMATLLSGLFTPFAVLWLGVREGLEVDAGTWVLCALPCMLLLPRPMLLPVLFVTIALIWFSSYLLNGEEKERITTWLSRQWFRSS